MRSLTTDKILQITEQKKVTYMDKYLRENKRDFGDIKPFKSKVEMKIDGYDQISVYCL